MNFLYAFHGDSWCVAVGLLSGFHPKLRKINQASDRRFVPACCSPMIRGTDPTNDAVPSRWLGRRRQRVLGCAPRTFGP